MTKTHKVHLPLLRITADCTEKSKVLRKCVALKMKGKCFVTRVGEGICWKAYVILPDKSKEKGLHKMSSINSALVSYLTSMQLVCENEVLFDSDENSAKIIEIFC